MIWTLQQEYFVGQILQYSDSDNLHLSLLELKNSINLLIFSGSDICTTVPSGIVNYLIKTPHVLKSLIYKIRSGI